MSAERSATGSEPLPELWKVDRVCEVLNLSAPTVYRLMEGGSLPYVRFGRSRRIKRSDVLKYIEENTISR